MTEQTKQKIRRKTDMKMTKTDEIKLDGVLLAHFSYIVLPQIFPQNKINLFDKNDEITRKLQGVEHGIFDDFDEEKMGISKELLKSILSKE